MFHVYSFLFFICFAWSYWLLDQVYLLKFFLLINVWNPVCFPGVKPDPGLEGWEESHSAGADAQGGGGAQPLWRSGSRGNTGQRLHTDFPLQAALFLLMVVRKEREEKMCSSCFSGCFFPTLSLKLSVTGKLLIIWRQEMKINYLWRFPLFVWKTQRVVEAGWSPCERLPWWPFGVIRFSTEVRFVHCWYAETLSFVSFFWSFYSHKESPGNLCSGQRAALTHQSSVVHTEAKRGLHTSIRTSLDSPG